eukprot:CAMPEP_0183751440 /NCGR_PEP_ID=MMETSP0739-20130205/1741_1 /TAXON_ID=385413 /ORGANISM="Thalassiosira miniscula, Strain CCMP1093" /LENGTH=315 /DNA_ID=CAMNT_0025987667 /DNA_START=13 /DNA_END=957 /DNA_ORIENTATION=+
MTSTIRHPPMSATATLTNCYVPLPVPFEDASSTSFDPFSRPADDHDGDNNLSNRNNSKGDGGSSKKNSSVRGPRTLRQIHLDRAVLSQSTGSSLVEWGHTKLMVSVRGPRPVNCSSMNAANNGGGLVCEVRYMPHIGVRMETLAQHSLSHDFSSKTSGGARIPRDALGTAQDISLLSSGGSLCAPAAFLDETYLSHRLTEALTPAVILEGLGNKMCIELFVEVLQSDGGVFSAAVAGASLALADAGVAMRDVVCAGSAAVMKVEDDGKQKEEAGGNKKSKVTYRAIADPTEDEILQASGVVTIAMMPNWREVTVW